MDDENLKKMILIVFTIVIIGILALTFFINSVPKTVGKSTCYYFVSLHENLNKNLFTSFISNFILSSIYSNCPIYKNSVSNDRDFKKIFSEDVLNCWQQYGEGNMNPFLGSSFSTRVCGIITFSNSNLKYSDLIDYIVSNKPVSSSKTYFESLLNENYQFNKVLLICKRGEECAYITSYNSEGSYYELSNPQLGEISLNEGIIKIFYMDDWRKLIWDPGKEIPNLCSDVSIPNDYQKNARDAILICLDVD